MLWPQYRRRLRRRQFFAPPLRGSATGRVRRPAHPEHCSSCIGGHRCRPSSSARVVTRLEQSRDHGEGRSLGARVFRPACRRRRPETRRREAATAVLGQGRDPPGTEPRSRRGSFSGCAGLPTRCRRRRPETRRREAATAVLGQGRDPPGTEPRSRRGSFSGCAGLPTRCRRRRPETRRREAATATAARRYRYPIAFSRSISWRVRSTSVPPTVSTGCQASR